MSTKTQTYAPGTLQIMRSLTQPGMRAVIATDGLVLADGVTEPVARLIAAAPALLASLRTIEHSMRQAQIPGNDYRREIQLTLNVVSEALALAADAGTGGTQKDNA